jgi:dihydrofolate reductase
MTRTRKFIVYVAVSTDGFIARGGLSRLVGPRYAQRVITAWAHSTFDRYLCSRARKTYDLSVGFGMRDGYAGKKNYVFSRTLSKAASPKVVIVNEDVISFAERLRAD